MGATAFDHPFLSGLVGDEETSAWFTGEADIRAMLQFEAALARAEAAHDVIPEPAAQRISAACAGFKADLPALRAATARDGVVVPELVRQLRTATGDASPHVHVGATSQDVIDTSLMLRLKPVAFVFAARLAALELRFAELRQAFGDRALMGRTRMQAAIPIAVADRLRAWHAPLGGYRETLTGLRFPLQFGGAAGTLDKLGDKASAVRSSLAQELGLFDIQQWQSQRAVIAEFAGLLAQISGSLGKFGQDVALMAQAGDEIGLTGGGGSSAMAHKQNPVAAETLVALARFNATQISAIHHSMVHEQERSGAAWTLEWLVLPQMAIATGAALRLVHELASNISRLGTADT
ncbi:MULTISPECIES: 3-carboxy-cis,cis-muconate cycloisomerase [unclassified Rhizobium]|uniref:3-carboxy-cis,cis-muconate cycloisomerase n=1 Tax=unclassified Rhizobium TaxID=2613769 RepID=UPI001AD9FD3F|nr:MULTISPECIES: 3-carboxy-cis,cis-muconate cycloisomerase [unclassified Rhizobium]MBO9126688.1 3-carboxy-cis,cis-muconate cycloisomerase [Rhizobium sp. 16-488-2b]MBO9177135.1 3-carboxy-cis,cis-muconate cycloisomerase [Rhizobium sp. 16-488-2a]